MSEKVLSSAWRRTWRKLKNQKVPLGVGADLETVLSSLWAGSLSESENIPDAVASEIRRTKPLREWLDMFLRTQSIGSVLDLGCGRFSWGQAVKWPEFTNYLGLDQSRQMILENGRSFSHPRVHFATSDILGDRLPTADLVIARGVFELLTGSERRALFLRLQTIAPRYVLLSEGSGMGLLEVSGQKSQLDWTKAPFSLPTPLATIPDTDWRRLHLWAGSSLTPDA